MSEKVSRPNGRDKTYTKSMDATIASGVEADDNAYSSVKSLSKFFKF